MSKEKKKQIIFHVVNSNSRNCKNTKFSMNLTYYYQHQKKQPAYLIDLDWKHSKYWNRYKHLPNYKTLKQKAPYYINELMFDFNNKSKEKFTHKLIIKNNAIDNATINACVSDPEPKDEIDLSEVELDLFENTIYNIIHALTAKHISTNKTIHFILDMPSGSETHSENIINHLLLDQSSPLYKKFNFSGYKEIAEYSVKFYILNNRIRTNSAKEYLDNLVKKSSYSSVIDKLNRNECLKTYSIAKTPDKFKNQQPENESYKITYSTNSLTEFKNADCKQFQSLIKQFV